MMQRITGKTQYYAWGDQHAIASIRGTAPSGNPEAEYWLGAHPAAPSMVTDTSLPAIISANPALLGDASRQAFGDRLPFLLKILAAAQPLSLQAHPTREQAVAGFARENAAGVELSAPERTYKDDWPKPEAIVALSEFHALCGFRHPARTLELFDALEIPVSLTSILGPLSERRGSAAMAEVFLDLLSLDKDRKSLVEHIVAAAVSKIDAPGELGLFARTAVELDEFYPSDPSIVAAMLLNRVVLRPGEALFLEAGIMHAYIKGVGVEVMSSSDNVLRGGLTPKHIDVDELVSVVSFEPTSAQPIDTDAISPGVFRYRTKAPEFALWRFDLPDAEAAIPEQGARILLLTSGEATISNSLEALTLRSGEAVFLSDSDHDLKIHGRGQAFMAGPGVI
ncbi:MAG: mannose-6-phosphate isomerase, class I [Propionibacteriaceae bacterium]